MDKDKNIIQKGVSLEWQSSNSCSNQTKSSEIEVEDNTEDITNVRNLFTRIINSPRDSSKYMLSSSNEIPLQGLEVK